MRCPYGIAHQPPGKIQPWTSQSDYSYDRHRGTPIHPRGFTLHEALVSLTLIGIVPLGALSIARLLEDSGIATEVNTLVADLSLARSFKTARTVIVYKTGRVRTSTTEPNGDLIEWASSGSSTKTQTLLMQVNKICQQVDK